MNTSLPKIIRNDWCREPGQAFSIARILNHEIHPEGLDVERIHFHQKGELRPASNVGHIISIISGKVELQVSALYQQMLHLEAGCHVYLPASLECIFSCEQGTELLHVASAEPAQARGKKLMICDEQFIYACASNHQSHRWILTPQYLSRRIFLRHDQALVSKSGNPVSWFRTTMFDVLGLPFNQDGEPVFKMSYNSRTEFNVCYDVKGTARVRMARHPYKKDGQAWSLWHPLDSDSTYHLNESAGGPEEECYFDDQTQTMKYLRNRHEVYILDGYVSLFCMFDPAPTGSETHHPGEYSDYEPFTQVKATAAYEAQQKELAKFDGMVAELSLAKALGKLDDCIGSPAWKLYLQGRDTQRAIEAKLARDLSAEGNRRERVLEKWIGEQMLQEEPVK